jgi:UPF0176 protein
MLVVRTYYKFVSLPDFRELCEEIREEALRLGILGTILIAEEGINSTIQGTREDADAFWDFLTRMPRFSDLEFKESVTEEPVFRRLKVRPKKEIITIRNPLANPNVHVGQYVTPAEWDALLAQEDVVLVDTRNDYEVEAGTFRNAIDPKIGMFGEFPEWVDQNLDPAKHKKVAMFCTGGIRCEKASALLLSKGFEQVYHLRGGILKYIEEVPAEQSSWEGDCFVFDERRGVDHELRPSKKSD